MPEAPVFLLPAEVRNATLNYLAMRPYAEVAELIANLVKLQQASE